jgi:nucleoside triphosphate diphosphatase
MPDPTIQLSRLLEVMAALRHPQTGCPWDREQDFASIAPYTIEEAYEVADAIARDDLSALRDELGDLLFQVVYYARLAEERGAFDFADIAQSITDKMIRRHPHVFGGEAVTTGFWEAAKDTERAARDEHGALAGIATGLPALTHAAKLASRAARVGFDWPDAEAVLGKLDEEIAELRAEIGHPPADLARQTDELGDVLFTTACAARKLGIDPEAALRHANRKFIRRFAAIEAEAARHGLSVDEMRLDEMEAAWAQAKRREAEGPGPSSAE